MDYVLLLVSYLIGSIPFSLLIGKKFFQKDLRNEGSGNLGATNTFRVLGKKAGFVVATLDISKGFFAMYISSLFDVSLHLLLFGGAAIIGHALSFFIGFKGGKSVATTAGVFLYWEPILLCCAIAIFFITLKIWKYVSLSSMIAITAGFLLSFFLSDIWTISFLAVVTLFILYKHRTNIQRIRECTEPKIKWM